jgi:hypothetical protein
VTIVELDFFARRKVVNQFFFGVGFASVFAGNVMPGGRLLFLIDQVTLEAVTQLGQTLGRYRIDRAKGRLC